MRAAMMLAGVLLLPLTLSSAAYADKAEVLTHYEAYKVALDDKDYKAAARYAKQAYEASALLDETSDQTLALLENYTTSLFEARKFEESIEQNKNLINLKTQLLGKNSPQLIEYYVMLLDAYKGHDTLHKSIAKTARKAVKLCDKNYQKESLQCSKLRQKIAINFERGLEYRQLKSYINASYNYFDQHGDKTSSYYRLAKFYKGKFALATKKLNTSVRYLDEALQLVDQSQPDAERFEKITRAFLIEAHTRMGKPENADEHCQALGKAAENAGDRDYAPIFRVVPKIDFPSSRSQSVVLTVDIDERGRVINPKIVRSDAGKQFETAALDAAKRSRFVPTYKDGKPTVTEGVHYKYMLQL